MLRAGLETAAWITVDDTGARHAGSNGFCTQIGNDDFTWFGTRPSKSRLNFLDLLRAGHTDYVINEAALDYMRERALAGPVISQLAHLEQSGSPIRRPGRRILSVSASARCRSRPTRCCIATEGALWGSVQAHGLLRETVIVSDDAGQFARRPARAVLGACRTAGAQARHVHRPAPRRPAAHARADLVVLRRSQGVSRRTRPRGAAANCALASTASSAAAPASSRSTACSQRLHANKPELLMVLDRPEIPLHTNGSERDIRCHVTKRKISGGTHSDAGRDCRDAFLGLMQTCTKLGIAFWDYLGDRLGVPGSPTVPLLADLIRCRASPPEPRRPGFCPGYGPLGPFFASPTPARKPGKQGGSSRKQEVAAIRLPSACMRSPNPGFPPAAGRCDENGRVPVRRFTLGVTGLPQRPK